MPKYSDALTVDIRQRIDYATLFGEFVDLRGSGKERTARCVFHEDRNPSMSINVEEGLYLCHNPECGQSGDVFTFYERVRSLKFPEAVAELARRCGLNPDDYKSGGKHASVEQTSYTEEELQAREEQLLANWQPPTTASASTAPKTEPEKFVEEGIVAGFHAQLLGSPVVLKYFSEKRGISRETVEAFQIGHDGQRYQIPVRDTESRCVNIRRYKPQEKNPANKMISWREGFGTARLFPIDRLTTDEPVFLLEGELDCLLARQHGLNALTTTGGAGTWRETWNELFTGRKVVICYDNDGAGKKGAINVASHLVNFATTIKIVSIPLTQPVGADFTDYIVGHGHSIEDFLLFVEQAPFFQKNDAVATPRQTDGATDVHLSQASRAEYFNQPVRFPVMVSGKTTSPFIIPREVRAGCAVEVRGSMPMCERCPVQQANASITKRMDFESNELLTFANVTDAQLSKAVKAKVGIPSKCTFAKHTVLEAMNVEEVQLIPEVDRTEAAAPYVTTAAYYMGHGLEANQSYLMTGVTVPEPKRQLATVLVHTAVKSQSNIDAFRLTTDVIERLRAFNPVSPGVQGLWQRLGDIYEDLETFTRIYQRRDLMLTFDLTIHSILRFKFQSEVLTRGWVEGLIIGDSRTGKSNTAMRLHDYYGAGEFSTGENTTLAGLIGGLHQVGTSWALQWGRIPLNDRRHLTIDEAGNLPPEQIARMSSMRSSGVAEVIKVHTERTNARTRMLWISNPRSPRPLSSFTQGVLAVKELIGAPEDIARFDLVASAASGDVPLAVVNASRTAQTAETFSRELCHQRVMWAWSRSIEQLVFANGAEDTVLLKATEHGEKYRYVTEIPLVEPNEQRVKIARLAASTAAIFFSASEDGQQVIVKPEHVEFACQFLDDLYHKPSLQFAEYAEMQRRRYQIAENNGKIESIMKRGNAARTLMEQEQFNQRDLQEILAYDERDDMREAVTILRDSGFLKRVGTSFYQKTPAAIIWLRKYLSGHRTANGTQRSITEMTEKGDVAEEPEW